MIEYEWEVLQDEREIDMDYVTMRCHKSRLNDEIYTQLYNKIIYPVINGILKIYVPNMVISSIHNRGEGKSHAIDM